MRVLDPAWIGMKLRKLLNYAEPLGDFMAFVRAAASAASRLWPSTVAYLARLVIHRYAMLGVLDEARLSAARDGHPRVAGASARSGRRRRWRARAAASAATPP